MKRNLRIVAYLAIWGILVAFVIRSVGRFPTVEEWAALIAEGGGRAMLAFGVFFLIALVLRAYRFGFLIRKMAAIEWGLIARAFPWLFMAGAVTPFRLGEIVRADWVRRHGGSGSRTFGLWVAERMTDMLMLVSLGLVGLAFVPGMTGLRTPLLVLMALVVAGYLALSFGQGLFGRLAVRLPVGKDLAASVLEGLSYMRHPRAHAAVFALTALVWGAMILAFWSGLSLALGAAAPLSMAILCMAAVNLAAILSAAPGNIGSFQAAGIAVLIQYDVDPGVALVATTLLQATGLAITLALGTLSWLAGIFVKDRRVI